MKKKPFYKNAENLAYLTTSLIGRSNIIRNQRESCCFEKENMIKNTLQMERNPAAECFLLIQESGVNQLTNSYLSSKIKLSPKPNCDNNEERRELFD